MLLFLTACGFFAPTPAQKAPAEEAPAADAPSEAPAGDEASDLVALCGDSWRLLTRLPYDEVQQRVCELCGEQDPMYCELDWPFNDVPSCEAWAEGRNTIFAHYGYVFENDRWKQYFAKQSWYEPDPSFDPESMPQVAKDNVARLQRHEKEHVGCTPD